MSGKSYEPIDWAAIRAETAADLESERIHGIGGLRDQIAMAALTGILGYGSRPADADTDAKWSYACADAMLEARKATP